MIKAITFDLDNTLWDGNSVIIKAEKTLIDWLKNQSPHLKAITREMIVHARDMALRDQPHLVHHVTQLRRQGLKHLLIHAGHNSREAEIMSEQALNVFLYERQKITPFDDAHTLLQTLQSRFVLGTLTNGNADLAQTNLHAYFDFSFSAENIGVRKPGPEIFQAVLNYTKLQPNEVLHVGDHPEEDILGAKAAGFHAVWANFTNEKWPYVERVDHQIAQLLDLLPIIDRLNLD